MKTETAICIRLHNERCFFIELSEIITGKDMDGAKCTKKSGDAPKQTVDFEEMAAASGSLDLVEKLLGRPGFRHGRLRSGRIRHRRRRKYSIRRMKNSKY
jgi:hypothetical protein